MPENLEYLMLIFAAVFGAVFGSFVNMAASRIPNGSDLVFAKSSCPNCRTNLKFWDLIPIFSWLLLRGKCRYCKLPIGIRYFLTEVIMAIAFVVIWQRFGISTYSLLLSLMAICLAIIIVVDFEHYIIPDSCQFFLLVLGVIQATQHLLAMDLVKGVGLGLGIGLCLRYFYMFFLKKDALGLGDVKFLGIAGLWLGPINFIPFIFYSGLLGVMIGSLWVKITGSRIFPFGPALAAALFISLCFPESGKFFWKMLSMENIP